MQQTNENTYALFQWMIQNELSNEILKEKQQIQDKNIEKLFAEVDDLNFKMNTIIPSGYNYRRYSVNDELNRSIMDNSEQTNILNQIISEVQKLDGLDDIRDQVASCAYICDKTLLLLKKLNISNNENYCKQALQLFFQAIKRNYSKRLFTDEQINIMLDILKESKNLYLDETKYWEFDEQLYYAKSTVFPEEE